MLLTAERLPVQGSKSSGPAGLVVSLSQEMSSRQMKSQQRAPTMSVATTTSTTAQPMNQTEAANAASSQWKKRGANGQQQTPPDMLSAGARAFAPQDQSLGTAGSAMQGTIWVPAQSTAPIASDSQLRSSSEIPLQGSWDVPTKMAQSIIVTKAATAMLAQRSTSTVHGQERTLSVMLSADAQAFAPQVQDSNAADRKTQETTWVSALSTTPTMSTGQVQSVK